MKGTTIFEIAIVVVLAVAFIIFLIRRNIKDVEDANPDLTKALKDAEKQGADNKEEK